MPKKSPIWVHFSEESEGKVTCLYCGQQLSVKNKSTCSLIRHMNQKHPAQSISRRTITEAPIKEANCSIEQQQPAEDSAIKLYQQPSTSGAVCLTTNGWAFRKNDSFHTVTAHYIVEETNNTFLSSDLLGCISFTERHTAEDIANKLKEVIDDWKLTNKIVAVVSDNAENMKTAMSIGGWSHWDCLAHSLNLVSQSDEEEYQRAVENLYTEVANTKLVDENVENKTSDNIIKIKVEPIEQKIAPEKNLLDALWDDFDAKARQSLNPSDSTASAIVETSMHSVEVVEENEGPEGSTWLKSGKLGEATIGAVSAKLKSFRSQENKNREQPGQAIFSRKVGE
ncbi:hypothetical protein HUJ05_007957 [Dendroctonus ponderosae]|nr:hypothetical protein HUJ05_007957 [Dendroctonus ponderosae]